MSVNNLALMLRSRGKYKATEVERTRARRKWQTLKLGERVLGKASRNAEEHQPFGRCLTDKASTTRTRISTSRY
jgi:hypothetical protein